MNKSISDIYLPIAARQAHVNVLHYFKVNYIEDAYHNEINNLLPFHKHIHFYII
jgi:hypothetical protein